MRLNSLDDFPKLRAQSRKDILDSSPQTDVPPKGKSEGYYVAIVSQKIGENQGLNVAI